MSALSSRSRGCGVALCTAGGPDTRQCDTSGVPDPESCTTRQSGNGQAGHERQVPPDERRQFLPVCDRIRVDTADETDALVPPDEDTEHRRRDRDDPRGGGDNNSHVGLFSPQTRKYQRSPDKSVLARVNPGIRDVHRDLAPVYQRVQICRQGPPGSCTRPAI